MKIITIDVNKVTKLYGKEKVLNDVSAQFEKGMIHGLIGKNGSGKSMLMKTICGFVRPSSGVVMVNEKVVGKDVDFPDDIGLIIESPGFIPYYNGMRNLMILAHLRRYISDEQVTAAIKRVGLDPNSRKHVRKYSMGMNQRLGIAQAIMENPSILILDEPMNGLDKQGINDVRDLLMNLREEGKTILISSHYMEDIDILCDTVCEMDGGKLTRIL